MPPRVWHGHWQGVLFASLGVGLHPATVKPPCNLVCCVSVSLSLCRVGSGAFGDDGLMVLMR